MTAGMIEHRYSLHTAVLADWQRAVMCDICLRYMATGPGGGGNVEGTMFCAAACPGEDCRWPASPELVAMWRAWAEERAAEWERVAAEARPIAEARWSLERRKMAQWLPVVSVGCGITGRVVG